MNMPAATADPFALSVNPFRDEYLEREVDFYGMRRPYRKGRLRVEMARPRGRLDDYLNTNFRAEGPLCPVLFTGKQLWMSLTFMEVQSLFVPIEVAEGDVATCGLGLGYYALRVVASDVVDSLDVYERSQAIIRFFQERFCGRPGLEKIRFIQGDARERMVGKRYDHVFVDIYSSLLPDEVVDDAIFFQKENDIGEYRFWGMERVIVDEIMEGGQNLATFFEGQYFRAWRDTPMIAGDPDTKMVQLWRPMTIRAFRKKVFEALGR